MTHPEPTGAKRLRHVSDAQGVPFFRGGRRSGHGNKWDIKGGKKNKYIWTDYIVPPKNNLATEHT